MAGQVVHFEVPADDLDRASRFYSDAFGWRLRAMPGMDYTLVSTAETGPDGAPAEGGAINGGMLRRSAPVTAPVITIQVDDIDAALEAVQRLGGTVALGRQAVGE